MKGLGLGKTFGKPGVDEDSFMVQPMVLRENPKTVTNFIKFALFVLKYEPIFAFPTIFYHALEAMNRILTSK